MDPVSGVSQSIEAVNQIMQAASSEAIEMAEKQVKVAVSLAVGKGQNFDAFA